MAFLLLMNGLNLVNPQNHHTIAKPVKSFNNMFA